MERDHEPRASTRLGVARVVAPRGLHGEVAAEILTEFPERFAHLERLFLGDSDAALHLEAHRFHKGRILLQFREVNTPEEAEALRDTVLTIPVAEAVPLPPGHYYQYQIVGLEVYTTDGKALGKVADILATGGNDVYVVRGPGGEILLPATRDVVRQIDLGAGRMIVHPLPGMVE